MRLLRDYAGVVIRLTDERRAHILTHPEMVGMEQSMEETLISPHSVIRSRSDEQTSCTIGAIQLLS